MRLAEKLDWKGLMQSSKFLVLWVLDERRNDSPTCGTQFVNWYIKDLEKENRITKQETVKDEKKIYVKTLSFD
jgi:phosphatidylethanolamine-binding protein (PEBP) family uncharacterized protein